MLPSLLGPMFIKRFPPQLEMVTVIFIIFTISIISIGILTHQGHISKVNANDDSVTECQ